VYLSLFCNVFLLSISEIGFRMPSVSKLDKECF
jgi:hypothetical protein